MHGPQAGRALGWGGGWGLSKDLAQIGGARGGGHTYMHTPSHVQRARARKHAYTHRSGGYTRVHTQGREPTGRGSHLHPSYNPSGCWSVHGPQAGREGGRLNKDFARGEGHTHMHTWPRTYALGTHTQTRTHKSAKTRTGPKHPTRGTESYTHRSASAHGLKHTK